MPAVAAKPLHSAVKVDAFGTYRVDILTLNPDGSTTSHPVTRVMATKETVGECTLSRTDLLHAAARLAKRVPGSTWSPCHRVAGKNVFALNHELVAAILDLMARVDVVDLHHVKDGGPVETDQIAEPSTVEVEPVAVGPASEPAPIVAESTITRAEPTAVVVRPEPTAGSLDAMVRDLVRAEMDSHPSPVDVDTVRDIVTAALVNVRDVLTTRTVIVREPHALVTLAEHVHPIFERVAQHLTRGYHVALVGPAGTGKTHLTSQIARALGEEYSSISCGPDMGKHELLGYRNAMGDPVRTDYENRYENGGIMTLDEMDAASGAVLTGLGATLANGHATFADGLKVRHASFRVVACLNTFGMGATSEYVGRTQLDAATRNRFRWIPMDYDRDYERLTTLAYMTNDQADTWLRTVETIRTNIATHSLRAVMSTRDVVCGADMIGAGIETVKQSLETGVLAGQPETAQAKILQGVTL